MGRPWTLQIGGAVEPEGLEFATALVNRAGGQMPDPVPMDKPVTVYLNLPGLAAAQGTSQEFARHGISHVLKGYGDGGPKTIFWTPATGSQLLNGHSAQGMVVPLCELARLLDYDNDAARGRAVSQILKRYRVPKLSPLFVQLSLLG